MVLWFFLNFLYFNLFLICKIIEGFYFRYCGFSIYEIFIVVYSTPSVCPALAVPLNFLPLFVKMIKKIVKMEKW